MKTYQIDTLTLRDRPAAVMRTTALVSQIGPWLGEAYASIAAHLAGQGVAPEGPPFARYHRCGADRFEVEAGFFVPSAVSGGGRVEPRVLPGGTAAVPWHTGPYDTMTPAYEALAAWLRDHGCEPLGDPWEVYHSDPAAEPDPQAWRTEIVQPFRPAPAG